MRTDLLFDQFDTLLTTPDDVARLEAAVLQLAVQGKVVPQDPDDEPATKLFERIRAEKERLVREGQIRKPKPLPPIEADEIPYELPESWSWVRLGEATNYSTSDKVKAGDITDDTWVLDLQDIEKVTSKLLARVKFSERRSKSSKTIFRKGDVLYGKLRPYLDKVLVVAADGVCSSEIIPMRGYLDIDPYYLRYALKRPDFIAYVNSKTYGVKMPRLGTPDARMALLPLPPLTEQKRIVAKVDELLAQTRALVAQLDQADAALVPAAQAAFQSLLDAQDTTAQDEAWQRIADHFDTLTSDPRTIDALKQTVLQLAVQGKLVPQDPDNEPATELLKQIKAQKTRLVREGRIRKPKQVPSMKAHEIPFVLPETWKWCRLADVSLDVHYGYTASADSTLKDFRFLRITDIQNNTVAWEQVPGCDIDDNKAENYLLKDGDILIARTGGTIGKSYLVEALSMKAVFASYLIRVIPSEQVDAHYLKRFLESLLYWEQLMQESKGTGQPNVNATSLRQLALPLPPLAEQKRIVAKVEALLALCDALAAEVAAAEEVRGRLLQAVLNGS